MKYKNQEELESLAKEYSIIRDKLLTSKSKVLKSKFVELQALCMSKFKYLVLNRASRYRQFSNYQDLVQDGFEALLAALRTYNYKKGSFTWWADKYITTKISRAANNHSTIKYPIKKTKLFKPHKVDMPLMIDERSSAFDCLEEKEKNTQIKNILNELPIEQKKVVGLIYGIGCKPHSVENTHKMLSISKPQVLKLLNEAKNNIKELIEEERDYYESYV